MSAGINFFVCSCAILALAIVNINVGPSINHKVTNWASNNCKKLSDEFETKKEKNPDMSEKDIELAEKKIRQCRNTKAMYEMEYAAFITNIGIGFICVILGLYGIKKEIMPKSGLVGMIFGIAGFCLTIVYVVFNGIVYTNYYEIEIYKRDGDAAFAELDGERYKCLYFNKENDTDALIAKYSDLIKSQYNYNNDLYESFNDDAHPEKSQCISTEANIKSCAIKGYLEIEKYYIINKEMKRCEKLYYYYKSDGKLFNDYIFYDKSARFLTALIMSLLTILCHVGLAFSGFMIFKESN